MPPPEGTALSLEFEEEGIALTIPARVVHAGWYLEKYRNLKGFGVHFEKLPSHSLALIEKVLDRSREPAPDKCVLEP